MVRKKQCGRIAHFTQAFFAHGKHAELVHRTKPVLESADQTKAGMGVAFEIQYRIHHVLQYARPGQRAFLGHMPHQDDTRATGLGQPRQLRGALADLGD